MMKMSAGFRIMHGARIVQEVLRECYDWNADEACALENMLRGAGMELAKHGHDVLDIYIPDAGESARIHCADIAFDIKIAKNPARIG